MYATTPFKFQMIRKEEVKKIYVFEIEINNTLCSKRNPPPKTEEHENSIGFVKRGYMC